MTKKKKLSKNMIEETLQDFKVFGGNSFYYINCSGIASGSKSRKMVSHMCG